MTVNPSYCRFLSPHDVPTTPYGCAAGSTTPAATTGRAPQVLFSIVILIVIIVAQETTPKRPQNHTKMNSEPPRETPGTPREPPGTPPGGPGPPELALGWPRGRPNSKIHDFAETVAYFKGFLFGSAATRFAADPNILVRGGTLGALK